MTSILKNLRYRSFFLLALATVFATVVTHRAQAESVSLSVTPTLIEISAEPGRSWESSIKVINNNPFDLTIYAAVVNFAPEGEGGQGAFLPPEPENGDNLTISSWLSVPGEAIVIPRESSAAVPIKLNVPQGAAPGGHYAAIQVGTKPLTASDEQSVRTSQLVTSLFFARIAGDIHEDGSIRSFRAAKTFVGKPEATFELRFENKGNVHLQPQGDIIIKNMWGSTRGTIPVNQQTHFGNVLPESIRKFDFTWNGVFSLADIGRYTAEVTLAYGTDARQFTSRATSFYVIPLKALTLVLLILIATAFFARFVIRSYVRRMLYLAGVDPDIGRGVMVPAGKLPGRDVRIERRSHVTAPVRAGYQDLRTRMSSVTALRDKIHAIISFIVSYRAFFVSLLIFALLGLTVFIYIRAVTDSDVPYEVTIEHTGEPVTLSSEQIAYDNSRTPVVVASDIVITDEATKAAQAYTLVLTNASGKSGVAAELKTELEAEGYHVDELRSDLSGVQQRTVIVYDPAYEHAALELSARLNNALLSASSEPADTAKLNIFIGAERLDE